MKPGHVENAPSLTLFSHIEGGPTSETLCAKPYEGLEKAPIVLTECRFGGCFGCHGKPKYVPQKIFGRASRVTFGQKGYWELLGQGPRCLWEEVYGVGWAPSARLGPIGPLGVSGWVGGWACEFQKWPGLILPNLV